MKNLAFVTGLFLASILFTGCASILTKTTYPVAINSSPEGANVTITGKKGTMVYEGTTPAIVKLKSSNGFFSGENYMIKFDKEGYQPVTRQVGSKVEGWYWGNILFGGLIGMIIVDPATGAMYKLDTEAVDISLVKLEKNAENQVNINSIPEDWKKHLVLIKEGEEKSTK